jgi:hypothetical protein
MDLLVVYVKLLFKKKMNYYNISDLLIRLK